MGNNPTTHPRRLRPPTLRKKNEIQLVEKHIHIYNWNWKGTLSCKDLLLESGPQSPKRLVLK